MMKVNKFFPLSKEQLIEHLGFLSFQTVLLNIEVVCVRIVKSYEVVVIAYRGNNKVGFIYEGGNLSSNQIFKVYSDAPDSFGDLEKWENSLEGKIELLYPIKGNYVFINDKEVEEAGKKHLQMIKEKLKKYNSEK